ncbi:Receptor-type guanylate cyclase gcy [Seminavis robusta]|uniref:Receptor-type guanylate cyclase gcy n=1 Tax=Seminavis robusta TaxID=568900 RepID=A0A9N8D967_9STRA|nr:Receptor-type guanylate cyclase gcy [Seminavis robusta]|eukprot:Sro21_g014520.1 Receptor-type guanylate cyclase gcy (781) ;mRNA; r:22601-25045
MPTTTRSNTPKLEQVPLYSESESDSVNGGSEVFANDSGGGKEDMDGSGNHKHHFDDHEALELAKKEDTYVWYLRFVVTALLGAMALAVCLSVYFVTKRSEEADMENDFVDLSEKLVDTFELTFQQRFGIVDNFAQEFTSYEKDAPNVTWPLVTMPDFERRAGRTAALADLFCILILPMVPAEQRVEWEQYAVANQGWRGEGLALQQGIPIEDVEVGELRPRMFKVLDNGTRVPEDRPGPYFPIWQTFPAVDFSGHTHLNLYRWKPLYTNSIDAILKQKKPVLPASYDYWGAPKDDLRRVVFNKYVASYSRYSSQTYEDDPVMSFFYPIFDRLDGKPQDREVKAVLLGAIYWRTYFNGILPPGANGIHVILENQCDQTYTYRVDGTEAQFLGHGDLHDTKYDYLETQVDLTLGKDIYAYDNNQEEQDQDRLEADCRYKLRVYPSQEFHDDHTSNKPLLYTISLAAVFIFTSAVFLLYDYCVERRQKVLLKSARQSGAIVQNLFPENVRNRMYQEQEEEDKMRDGKDTWKADGGTGAAGFHGRPNADLFQETTVFFADLVGFTAWSSKRTPVEVFELLEALYGAFDKIAKRRKVFKVETIGDCYVAVTGIPEPQDNHAAIMARFAVSCMAEMNRMTHDELAETLGEDTKDLEMRVGLHSGPTTAGVLRGERGRFQLFGDTVNVASRMESNGVRGRIHASQSTADALTASGKGHWLTPREEKILAKGKGEMQTYWVQINPGTARTGLSSAHSNHSGGDKHGLSSAHSNHSTGYENEFDAVADV